MTFAADTQNLSKSQTQLKQDTTQELSTTNTTIPACVNTVGYLEKGTGKHQSNIVYDSNGLVPTEYAVQWKEPFKVVECQKL